MGFTAVSYNMGDIFKDIENVAYGTPFVHRKGQLVFVSFNFTESLPEGIGHTKHVGSC